jgi:hypothetical protein
MQDGFDLDHTVLGVTAADVAALCVGQRMQVLAMTSDAEWANPRTEESTSLGVRTHG